MTPGVTTSASPATAACPGCGMIRPRSERGYARKFHASAECWEVFEEVLAREFQSPALFGKFHQLTVDAYAVQHAGGRHPDKSVAIHLVGLYLVMEEGLAPAAVAPRLQRIASRKEWPRLDPPAHRGVLTVLDVASAEGGQAHTVRVAEWAGQVWSAWSKHHGTVRELATRGESRARPTKRRRS